MYRIHFDPKKGFWVVQFLRWGFFWVSVKEAALLKNIPVPKSFPDFDAALHYVEEKGITRVYRDRTGSAPPIFDNPGYERQVVGPNHRPSGKMGPWFPTAPGVLMGCRRKSRKGG